MYECRCGERLETKTERSTLLVYTVFRGGLEHLKIETRLMDERFVSVIGECVIVKGVPSIFNVIRNTTDSARMFPTLDLSWEENTT
jgi:hypothetical protein